MPPPTDPLALLRGERNVRHFSPDPVPDGAIAAILEVARWTGSAKNAQPWRFVVVRDRATIQALARTGPNLPWMAGAPLLIVLVIDGDDPETEGFDEGRLAERVMLAARARGLGAGLGWFLPGPPRDAARAILGVPPERVVRTLIAIGTAAPAAAPPIQAQPPGPGARKPLPDLISNERYGDPAG